MIVQFATEVKPRQFKIESEMTFKELHANLYRGGRFTFDEVRAAEELIKRGYQKTVEHAAKTAKRRLSRGAARHALKCAAAELARQRGRN